MPNPFASFTKKEAEEYIKAHTDCLKPWELKDKDKKKVEFPKDMNEKGFVSALNKITDFIGYC